MKKFVALLLALLMVLSLSACGKNGEESKNTSGENLISVEEVHMFGDAVRLKIRNLSGETQPLINVKIQALDANGDVIGSTSEDFLDVEPNQASVPTSSGYAKFQCDADAIASIKISSYHFGKPRANGGYEGGEVLSYNDPIISRDDFIWD